MINDPLSHLPQVAEWCQEYFNNVRQYPVFRNPQPGEIKRSVSNSIPVSGSDFESIFNEFKSHIVPGLTHWQHPDFFAYFPASRSRVSFLAEMLESAVGQQCMSWFSSPASSELEELTCDWIIQQLQLPKNFKGVLQDSGSTSNLVAVLAAREWKTSFQTNESGLFGHRVLRIYASSEIHSSIDKAVRIAGLGIQNLVKIPCLADYSMNLEALEDALQRDVEKGYEPCAIIGAYGTTGTTAVDNIDRLVAIKKKFNCWLHIDGSFAGCALILPEYREKIQHLQEIDSIVLNPHKWFFTNLDCSLFVTQHVSSLVHTFEISPSYLQTPQDSEVINYRDWGINLARRFRSLKLWFVLKYYGFDGLRKLLRAHIEQAQWMKEQIERSSDFELMAPVHFNLVCFRLHPEGVPAEELNQLNKNYIERLNASGRILLTQTMLDNKLCIRFVNGKEEHTLADVKRAWATLQSFALTSIL